MIKLSNCCATCLFANFIHKQERTICINYSQLFNKTIMVAKPMICQYYVKPTKDSPRFRLWNNPGKRSLYWNKEINKLNEELFSLSESLRKERGSV